MKFAEFADTFQIAEEKLTRYALNSNHPKGKHKARVFQSRLGYSSSNYQRLIAEIVRQILNTEAVIIHEDGYGQHIRADILVTGANGLQAIVRTGWVIASQSRNALLTTLYVKE